MVDPTSFALLGSPGSAGPVVIAVPHAGRFYPPALIAAARLPRSSLETIEDRHADLLVADAVAAGAIAIVARMARAHLDLNRDPREIDAAMLRPGSALTLETVRTEKVAGGLGVVPTRIAAGGAVWKRALDPREVAARIAQVHAPYHAGIAAALALARARHGTAILLDLHSMPPLEPPDSARIVIGDRFGKSCGTRFAATAAAVAADAGLKVARNLPYAGGFTLDRHGCPRGNVHALQIEVDRALYLDSTLLSPGPGLPAIRRLIAAVCAALADLAARDALPVAAE